MVLAYQANEFLVEGYRASAAIVMALFSLLLFIVSAMLWRGARYSKQAALAVSILVLATVVLGIGYMGQVSVSEALLVATCMPGVVLCFNHAASVTFLVALLFVAVLASSLQGQRDHKSGT